MTANTEIWVWNAPDVIEAVAKAICEGQGFVWDDQDSFLTSSNGDDDGKAPYLHDAEVAIQAYIKISASWLPQWIPE
jgi:hypothetical protein